MLFTGEPDTALNSDLRYRRYCFLSYSDLGELVKLVSYNYVLGTSWIREIFCTRLFGLGRGC